MFIGERGCAEVEEEGSQRGDEGEGEACLASPAGGEVFSGHECGDRESSEGFMEDDGEGGANAENPCGVAVGVGGDGSGHGKAIKNGVDREADGDSCPAEAAG